MRSGRRSRPARTARRAAGVLWTLAALAPAQQPRWNLPLGGLAVYAADEDVDRLPPEDGHALLPGCTLPHAAIVLQSELSADRTHLALEPQDWRWIAPLCAFDLRLPASGKVAFTLPRVPSLGDVAFVGKALPAATAGRQRYELEWRTQPIAAAKDEKARDVDRWRPWYDGRGSGTLQFERVVDADAGVVREFAAELALDAKLGRHHGGVEVRRKLRQSWRLVEVRENRARDFQARVAEAIEKGADRVEEELRPGREQFATNPDPNVHGCGEGHLALAILTLLACERDPDGNAVREGFAELKRREVRETYSLAAAILAVERAHAPPLERDNLLAGRIERPTPRALSAADAALVAEWSRRLLANRDASVDAAYRSRFWYRGGAGFDNSNTVYALLGLWSARLCQHDAGRGVWLAAAEHWLAVRGPVAGRAIALHLTPLERIGSAPLAELQPKGSARRAEPRGYGYKEPGDGEIYGGMTCAAIAGMSLCMAALELDKGASPLGGRLDDGIRSGFAWLAQHRTVRWHAGPPPHRTSFYFHWLYSLERACELSRTGLVDGWDWYHDGAQLLLAVQEHDGTFGTRTLDEQCFALLFLKKAQLPVLSGPR